MVVDNKIIGHKIKQRRESLSITQEKLGEMTGVTYQQIQKYEKGTNKVSAERLAVIAKNLDVPVNFFFDNAEEFIVSEEQEGASYGIKTSSRQEQELLHCFRSLPDKNARSGLVVFLKSLCNE